MFRASGCFGTDDEVLTWWVTDEVSDATLSVAVGNSVEVIKCSYICIVCDATVGCGLIRLVCWYGVCCLLGC